jgi:hypothetical protein
LQLQIRQLCTQRIVPLLHGRARKAQVEEVMTGCGKLVAELHGGSGNGRAVQLESS